MVTSRGSATAAATTTSSTSVRALGARRRRAGYDRPRLAELTSLSSLWRTSSAHDACERGVFSDTFAGIAPSSVPAFVPAQVVGVAVGLALALYPARSPA